jgi:hypothetical protein
LQLISGLKTSYLEAKTTDKAKQFLKVVTILFFGITALYHLLGSFFYESDLFNRISLTRHLLFLAIDSAFIVIYLTSEKWFKWLLIPFALQQIVSHVIQLIKKWQADRPDYISIIVLVFLPLLIYWHFKNSKD